VNKKDEIKADLAQLKAQEEADAAELASLEAQEGSMEAPGTTQGSSNAVEAPTVAPTAPTDSVVVQGDHAKEAVPPLEWKPTVTVAPTTAPVIATVSPQNAARFVSSAAPHPNMIASRAAALAAQADAMTKAANASGEPADHYRAALLHREASTLLSAGGALAAAAFHGNSMQVHLTKAAKKVRG